MATALWKNRQQLTPPHQSPPVWAAAHHYQHLRMTFTPSKFSKNENFYIPKDLQSCSRVWVRVDRLKRPLESPYKGPYVVKARQAEYFTIEYPSGKTENVSLNRLKPVIENSLCANATRRRRIQLQMSCQAPVNEDIDDNIATDPDPVSPDNLEANNSIVNQQVGIENEEISDNELPNHIKFARRLPFTTRSGRQITFAESNSIQIVPKRGKSRPTPERTSHTVKKT